MINPIFETALEHYDFPCGGEAFAAKEMRDHAFVVLRGRTEDREFVNACKEKLGIVLPSPLSLVSLVSLTSLTKPGDAECLWIASDEFLVLLPRSQKDKFLQTAKEAFNGVFAAAVDNSGTYSYLRLDGRHVKDVLAKVSSYDVSDVGLPAGKVVTTLAGKAQVVLFREPNESGTGLLVRFSFADYVWRSLVRAAGEYQTDLLINH